MRSGPLEHQDPACVFCNIARGSEEAARVFEDDLAVAFLDVRPLFEGHVLLVPRQHVVTLPELSPTLCSRLFAEAQLLALAVQIAMGAEGTFVAMNNTVSQSVPHFHVHVVPRSKGDGLKGFFWPRTKYPSQARMHEVAAAIRDARSTALELRGSG